MTQPTLSRGSAPVQRLPQQLDRAYLVPPIPFDVYRFRPRPAGFLSPLSRPGVTRNVRLSSGCLPPQSDRPSVHRTRERFRECTSLGVPSPTTLDNARRPYTPKVPPSGTVRPQGFSPSRRLSSPDALWALFHAHCALGVPTNDSPALARTFRLGQGDGARVSSTRPSLPLRRTRVCALSSHVLRRND